MADSSNLDYLYASNANVCNFVSVKLSSIHNYCVWKTQMLCLMESHDMCGIVDASFDSPRASSIKIKKQYDCLLKGWIFGSITEDVLVNVFNLESAKDVWEKLKFIYGNQTISFPIDSTQTKLEPEAKGKISENEKIKEKDRMAWKKKLLKATTEGDLWEVKDMVEEHEDAWREELNSDGNTILHIAVGIHDHNYMVRYLLHVLKGEGVVEMKNKNGSTALHIAAIVGNKDAAELLVNRNKNLLTIKDSGGEEPLLKAYSNMQFDTFMYLYGAATGDGKNNCPELHTEKGIDLLVNAISAKQYGAAATLVDKFPQFAVESDAVLMAIARTFPSGLTNWEELIYPSNLDDISERIIHRTRSLFRPLDVLWNTCRGIDSFDTAGSISRIMLFGAWAVPVVMLALVYQLILFLILVVYLPFSLLYFLSWKVATILVAHDIKYIENKKKEWRDANDVLTLVLTKISNSEWNGTPHFNYSRPILEAACKNASRVVDEILYRSPEAITSTDKSTGHDIIQLAVINRSENVYDLIYQLGERKSRYRTQEDCYGNNILHLAARLAPSHELNRRTGAALQLQRELQWREEVKKLVFPTYITKENIFKETPDMVFTREHKNLVKEGEAWMKSTAESCSITASLITTIVFAAAITVPGGSNQGTGIPIFTKDIAFIIFAISDAISPFTSTTSLLAFLSILTARFAEEDFLVRLPRRLIIGLCTLLLSTTAMMVAYSATLFLVFCHQKPWMLALICGLACLPIAFFSIVQFPLIVDLIRSTHGHTFSKQSNSHQYRRFNPNDVRGFFGK